jgi:hypothetical protein
MKLEKKLKSKTVDSRPVFILNQHVKKLAEINFGKVFVVSKKSNIG